ncbi:Outer membrane efflux protein [Mucinivorans hirudinis]|uniref:Outer membrane efflux protein n=1 Tax=Mucinivorans hirudinis TaxID=1433126 RepID=A0A060RC92_9BACT|nr:Outer membrane efflux protein [Mucinivorans hirudinis]
MKRNIFTALAIIFLIQNSPQCFAQGGLWSLEQCIYHAIENNLQVKQAVNNVDANKLNLEQAKFNYLPSLSGSAGYNLSFGRSLDPTTYQFIDSKAVNNFSSSLSLGTQLFAGMSKRYSLQRSELNLMASVQDVQKAANDISVAVAAAYLQILYNKEQVANSQNQLLVIGEQVARTKKLVEAESVPMGALLDLEAQFAAESYNLVNYKNILANSVLNLTQLLELKNNDGFDIEVPSVDALIGEAPAENVEDINDAAQELPQIKASKLRLEIAQTDIKLAQARLYPTINLGASYGSSFSDARQRPVMTTTGQIYYEKYPFFDQMGDNANSAIQISMQIPIFNALTARRNVSLAQVSARNTEITMQTAKNQLYKEIQQAYTDATSASSRYESAQASVLSSSQSFDYAQKRFDAGAINAVDYITAKNALLTAQSMMLQAKYEYIFRVKLLDFYKGVPITL